MISTANDSRIPMARDALTARVRKIDQLDIILTNRCNLHCISCSYPDQRPFRYVRHSTITRLLPSLTAAGLSRVLLTGGEPCMHPDFDEIVTDLHGRGLKLILVTNGTYVHKKLPTLAGKLYRLIVSLDSDSAEGFSAIRGANAFDHLIRLPQLVREQSPDTHLTLAILTQRLNFRRMPEFVELAARLEVDQVSFLVPDVPGLVAPIERGGAFGHVEPLPPDRVDQVALSLDEVAELRERVIPEVFAAARRHPELVCGSLDMLEEFADYFEAFRRGVPRSEHRRCALPFREVVLDELERLRFCFYMPDAWPAATITDAVNHPAVVAARRDYLESDRRLERHCNMCLQAVRVGE